MTTVTATNSNGPPRKTLASQIDRLDGILDGLEAALAGAVQDAVEQAVQAVLIEVLTNRELQEQLQKAAPPAPLAENSGANKGWWQRLWQATTERAWRTVQRVKQVGHGVGLVLLATGSVLAGIVYAARAKMVWLATAVYRQGQRLVHGAVSALTRLLPSFALSS